MVYRLGAFFVFFFVLGAVTEGIWQTLAQNEQRQLVEQELFSEIEELASLGKEKAAEAVRGLKAPEEGWLVTEPSSTSGLASLRKRKVFAATDKAQEGTAPSEEIALAAANIKSRSLEKKLSAQIKETEDGRVLLSAPIIENDQLIGSLLLKREKPVSSGQGQWTWLLLALTLGAALCGVLGSGEASLVRGLRTALGALFAWGGALYFHLSSPSGVILFGAVGAFALLASFLAGVGTLARWWEPIRKARFAYGYVAPAILGMLILVFIPFAVGVGLSFFEHEFGEWRFAGLENFSKIMFGAGASSLTSPDSFYYKLVVTLLWTTSNVFFHVAIGLGLALLLNQPNLRGKAFYRLILILPWAVPSYITALIWKRMFHPELGLVNALLGTQGMSWTDSFWKAFFSNLMTNIWLGVPFMMVVCLGALQSIPKDVYEAADIDGASSWQKFWKITVPLLRPALLPSIILGMIWTFNMFNVIYLVSEGKPGGATDILVTEAYRWAFERQERGGEYGYAAAYSTIIFLLLLVYSLGTAKVTGLTKGAQD